MSPELEYTLEILLEITRLFKSILATVCKTSRCGDCKFKDICSSINFIQDCIYELLGDE